MRCSTVSDQQARATGGIRPAHPAAAASWNVDPAVAGNRDDRRALPVRCDVRDHHNFSFGVRAVGADAGRVDLGSRVRADKQERQRPGRWRPLRLVEPAEGVLHARDVVADPLGGQYKDKKCR